jgi:hypothetical protein
MNKIAWIVLLASVSLLAFGQNKDKDDKDRNLAATRRHGDTTTVLPPRTATSQSAQKASNSQLDKLERQTANIVNPPAAKAAKAPAYKLPPDNQKPAPYQQTLPVHAAVKNGAGNASHSSRSASAKPYKR